MIQSFRMFCSLTLFIMASLSAPASALEMIAKHYFDNAELVGESRLTVFLFKVFDARLYAPDGAFDPEQPFALSLSYLRKIDSEDIVESTIKEIRAQGAVESTRLDEWERQLEGIIPDVDETTTITGVRNKDAHTLLYKGYEKIGIIKDPKFTSAFFNIWLGESTSRPQLRDELLAGG